MCRVGRSSLLYPIPYVSYYTFSDTVQMFERVYRLCFTDGSLSVCLSVCLSRSCDVSVTDVSVVYHVLAFSQFTLFFFSFYVSSPLQWIGGTLLSGCLFVRP